MVIERTVRIASRGSQLALWQANAVKDALHAVSPNVDVEILVIRTTGDRITDVPLSAIGDRGLFTKEIDAALLDGRADIAVHSLKDVPTRLPEGLVLAAVSERADPSDVLIGRAGVDATLESLPRGARVGTSSLRRRSQLRSLRSDLEVVDLRGNLNTRLARLDSGDYEAIILAAAGVLRLGWGDRISQHLPFDKWLPAVGQGALAIVAAPSDPELLSLLSGLHHPDTAAAVTAERSLLAELEGGCQIPIGALATVAGGGRLRLEGLVADLDGERLIRTSAEADSSDARGLGISVAGELRRRGADEILDDLRSRGTTAPVPPP